MSYKVKKSWSGNACKVIILLLLTKSVLILKRLIWKQIRGILVIVVIRLCLGKMCKKMCKKLRLLITVFCWFKASFWLPL